MQRDDEFEVAAAGASGLLGDLVIVDDDDERLVLTATGEFRAEVIPEEADGSWRTLTGPDELVEFYDPTDVFGDLADALAEAYPAVAPEYAGAAADVTATGDEEQATVQDADAGDSADVEDVEDVVDVEDEPPDGEDRPTA